MSVFLELNYLAIFLAVVLAQGIEAIWFSRGLFGYFWNKDVGIGLDGAAKIDRKYGFLAGFFLSLCTAILLSILIHAEHGTSPVEGMLLGLLAAGFVAVAQSVHFVYETRPLRFFLISIGYPILAYPLMGLVLGYYM